MNPNTSTRRYALILVSLFSSLLLILPAHAQTPANAFSYSRASAFEYNANGVLSAEIIEPDNPQLCVRTEYLYDSVGNRTQTLTKNCAGASGDALFTARQLNAAYAANAVNPANLFPTSTTNALGQAETKQYDNRFGAVTQLTGPNGLTTQWQYDGWGRKVLEIRADGNRTTWQYLYCNTAYGSPSTTCPSLSGGNNATLAYVVITTPQNSAGVQNAAQTKTYFDLLGRAIRSETQRAHDGAWVYSETFYNALGQVAQKSEPALVGSAPTYFTRYQYDALGRVIQETHPDSSAPAGLATNSIAYNGRVSTTTNARGQTQTKQTDPQGRLIRVTDHQGNQIAYQYDAFDNLLKTIDPLGNTSTLTYDIRGRKVAMNDPDMGNWRYTYNALGELTSQTDAKNQTTQLQYDVLGRLIAKLQPTQKNYWAYDKYADGSVCNKGIGKLCQTWSDNGYQQKIAFDNLGRPNSTQTTIDQVYTSSVSYDSNGRIASQTWPSGISIINSYSTLGALTWIHQADIAKNDIQRVLWQALEYNVRGQLTRFKYGNNIETVQSYAADTGRLTAIQAGVGYGVLNQQYQFDAVGNLTQRQDNNTNVTETYTYDSINRLQTQTLASGSVTRNNTWTYNALGNILNNTEVGAYTYNPSGIGSTRPHAITQLTGTAGIFLNPQYSYDANGNLQSVTSSNGNRRDHTFTSFNQPEALGMSGANPASAAFIYGSEGQRVKEIFARTVNGIVKTRTVYQIHPDNAGGLFYERELKEDGTIEHKHYVGGSIVILSVGTGTQALNITDIRYWHKDHLGSTVVVTNQSGAVLERLAYDPFGKRRTPFGGFDAYNQLRSMTTDRGFTGHEHLDDLGFIHMNGRVYDPTLGRFLSADPYIQFADNLQSYNRYSYLFNNPLNATDPTGYRWKPGGFLGKVGHELSNAWKNKTVKAVAIVVASIYTAGAASTWLMSSYSVTAAVAAAEGISVATMAAAVPTAFGVSVGTLAGVVGGAAGGFTAGFLASNGDLKAGIQGAITGGILGGVGAAVSDWSSSAAKVGVKAVTSASLVRIQGGNFGEALRYGLLSGAAEEAFRNVVGWQADPFPGKNQSGVGFPCDAPDSTCYTPDAERGRRIPESWRNLNVSGENIQMNGEGDYLKQGGWVGQIVNAIPGGKALSQFHDNLFNTGMLTFTPVTNWGTMLPAAAITYGALLDQLPIDKTRCPRCYR